MAAAIRESIINALETMLATITVSNGYRTEIATVETKAKDWAELKDSESNSTDGGWLGIVPQEETYVDHPGIIQSDWTIAIIGHLRLATNTEAAALTAASDLATDIRKLIYNTGSGALGVAGVHFARITRRSDSLGSPEAIEEKWTTARIDVVVRFEEAASLA